MYVSIDCAAQHGDVDDAGDELHLLAQLHLLNGQSAPAIRAWQLPLQLLATTHYSERWLVDEPVSVVSVGGDDWQLLHHFGSHLAISWLQFDHRVHKNFTAAMRWAYEEVLNHLVSSNHQHLLKIWHYLPGINLGDGDHEHYQQFCLGREQALRAHAINDPMPAATAIGIPRTDSRAANQPQTATVFYWLSSVTAPVNIENPRQTSAWHYPPRYGFASPNFSRASRLDFGAQNRLLLISGTASVSGHATAHPDNCAAQTDEMLLNLRSLIAAAGLPYQPEQMQLRIYLRQPRDWPLVSVKMQAAGFVAQNLLPLHGDICRRDLLVELDGVLLHARPASAPAV